MPYGRRHECTACKSSESAIWKKNEQKELICLACFERLENPSTIKEECPENSDAASSSGRSNSKVTGGSNSERAVRKSSRIRPSKYRSQLSNKPLATKGKSRRVIFKKNPLKAAPSVATVVTSEHIFYKGNYFQVGDIVSVVDEDTDNVYYAQLRGFLQDQYAEKSAVITWLLPTLASSPHEFDPATYVLGPEEDLPRKMEVFEFVCHAPSGYFRAKTSPYPTLPSKREIGYIWTSVGAQIQPVPSNTELYGLRSPDIKKFSRDKDKVAKEIKERELKEQQQMEKEIKAQEREVERKKEKEEREKERDKAKKDAAKERQQRRERREKTENQS